MQIIISKQLEHLISWYQYQLENGKSLHPSLTVSPEDILIELFWCTGQYLNYSEGKYFLDNSAEYKRKTDNQRKQKAAELTTSNAKQDIEIVGCNEEIIRISIYRK